MKRTLLLSFFAFTFFAVQAQITYEDYGTTGKIIHAGDNVSFDLNDDGGADFYINRMDGQVGFWPVFSVGCWASPGFFFNNLGSQKMATYEEGEKIMMDEIAMFEYIDTDPGLIWTEVGGLATDWQADTYYYVGFGVFADPVTVIDGWMKVKFDSNVNALVIREMAYTSPTDFESQTGIFAGEKQSVSTFDLIDKDQISVYPNPARDFIKVNYDAEKLGEVTLTVTNLNGQTILSQIKRAQKDNQWTIIPQDWPKGVYSLTIESLDGVYTERIFVE